MEPDIPANSSSPVVGAAGRHAADEAILMSLARDGSTSPATTGYASAFSVVTAPATGNGHTNGNGNGNGHALGNGHAHDVATETAVAEPMRRWPVFAGPVRAAYPAGRYAPALAASARDTGLYLRFGKRALDLIGALVALVLSAPLMLIAALAIKLESRGPVFYRSTRVGRGGRPFTFYKLRSMVNGADQHRHHLSHLNECDGPVFKISNDPRVTGVGRFLRTTSLDELPQFWNVLRGDMSLVGPRPPLPEEVSHYLPWQMRRLDVRPGITCLWQISGRSRIGFEEWMRLDLEYIKRQSFPMDLRILLRTIPAVLSREGAY
jgi:lipopolysaccharide/colanic/teichoic acid biosynthesis glycosyltransferase